ncbi:interferon-inducible GTPase-domain-containing protein [Rhodocollybia butyracea]|uniref:Interferon-inducible GTPase-domain-containing protein n=1 Tax=Rhodocollybia butyracea TaxID=206335 RepID=A0A9P5PCQ0_9AGAR|nr:interferon-inducible GTPase-domain-containing protein [Rhodocollybia butyracea]
MGGVVSAGKKIFKAISGIFRPNPTMAVIEHHHDNQAQLSEALLQANSTQQRANEAQRKAEEDQRKADEAQLRAEENQRSADEARLRIEAQAMEIVRQAKESQLQAENAQRRAEATLRDAEEVRRKVEAEYTFGIPLAELPTREEREETERRYHYRRDRLHIAIAGFTGTGKSSLINAFRGLKDIHKDAAATGHNETTKYVGRYPDPKLPVVWFDVPGAGTLNTPDWKYFNAQGLYIFDAVLIVFNQRFTATDIAILRNCKRYEIPSYIVRSQSDLTLQKIVKKKEEAKHCDDEDEDEDEEDDPRIVTEARREYKESTSESVAKNLKDAAESLKDATLADVAQKKVYLVSNDTVYAVVTGKKKNSKKLAFFDEKELVGDLLHDANERRLSN